VKIDGHRDMLFVEDVRLSLSGLFEKPFSISF